jgi:hypothetical protein
VQDDLVVQIQKGMEVEDADGDKVGKVDTVYQPARVVANASGAVVPAGEAYLKVHAGLPIIGTTYYIPSSAIRTVTGERVILEVDETRLDERGWDQRPSWIDD